MIVAIYLEGITLVLPVKPVGRIERLTPQDRRQDQHRQQPSSFASLLEKAMETKSPDDVCSFDSLV